MSVDNVARGLAAIMLSNGVLRRESGSMLLIDAFGTGSATTNTRGHYTSDDPGLLLSGTTFGRTFGYEPAGNSEQDGPTGGRYSLGVYCHKNNWTTSTERGEVGSLYLISSQNAFGDNSNILANAQILGKELGGEGGFSCNMEAVSQALNASTFGVTRSIGTQIGVINTRDENYYGYVAIAKSGSVSSAFLANASVGASWDYFLNFSQNTRQVLTLDGDGVLSLYNSTGSSSVQIRQNSGDILFKVSGVDRARIGSSGLAVGDNSTAYRFVLQSNGTLLWRDAYLDFGANNPDDGVVQMTSTGGSFYINCDGNNVLSVKPTGVDVRGALQLTGPSPLLAIGGVQVVGTRKPAISNPTDAATTQSAVIAILDALRPTSGHGLIEA